MEIQKKRIAHLDKVYAVAAVQIDGKDYCMAASENRGGTCLLIDIETGKCFTVWDGPGGVMSLEQVKGEQAVLSIEAFYPVFDSKESVICRTELAFEDGKLKAEKKKLCNLPYVHRIGLVYEGGKPFLVASTLCAYKAYTEDWSQPGSIFAGEYKKDRPLELTCLYEGLTKNHGMYIDETKSSPEIYAGAAEGILHIRKEGDWKVQLWDAGETSDICLADVDRDGTDEIAVIQGFHGEHIRLLKRQDGNFCCIGELPVRFGHVLWAGEIFGSLYLIGGSRGGDKELSLYRVERGEKPGFELVYHDVGTGAAQIAVLRGKVKVKILAASHGEDAVDMYTLTIGRRQER